jgi:IS1 transposase
VSRTTVYYWIRQAAARTEEPIIADDIREIEFDEMWHFIQSKKRKLWIIKAADRRTGKTIAWVLGGRDAATFQRLYDKLKHVTDCIFQRVHLSVPDRWAGHAENGMKRPAGSLPPPPAPSTMFGSTSKSRATARMPSPPARAVTAHTNLWGSTCLPCNGAP